MDRHQFLFQLQQKGLTGEWLPFQQSKYIQNILHGGIPTRSRLSEGVCHALCLYVLKKWMANGIKVDPIGELDRSTVAESIVEQSDTGQDIAIFKQMMSIAGRRPKEERYFLNYKEAVEYTTDKGFCLMVQGGIMPGRDGHTIICNGKQGAIFDPNVGYIKSNSTSNYTWAFLSVYRTFYTDYVSHNKAVQIFHFV